MCGLQRIGGYEHWTSDSESEGEENHAQKRGKGVELAFARRWLESESGSVGGIVGLWLFVLLLKKGASEVSAVLGLKIAIAVLDGQAALDSEES